MLSPEGDPLLTARGLRRSYGAVRVLHGVDVTVASGETLVVLGPNGAGKTTLLRILAGLMRPSAGDVRVLGRRIAPGEHDARLMEWQLLLPAKSDVHAALGSLLHIGYQTELASGSTGIVADPWGTRVRLTPLA